MTHHATAVELPVLPQQLLVIDRLLAKLSPQNAFSLRVQQPDGEVAYVDLPRARSMKHALRIAKRMGYHPTSWLEIQAPEQDSMLIL